VPLSRSQVISRDMQTCTSDGNKCVEHSILTDNVQVQLVSLGKHEQSFDFVACTLPNFTECHCLYDYTFPDNRLRAN